MIRVKLLPGGRLPERMSDGAAGWDCFANESGVVASGCRGLITLGFCVELPPNWEMQVRGRSSLALRDLCTHVGTIDSDYRGEVNYIFWNLGREPFRYERGQAICQVVFQQLPRAEILQVDELSETKRGTGGFGSTDLPTVIPIRGKLDDRCPRCDGFYDNPPDSPWRCICP